MGYNMMHENQNLPHAVIACSSAGSNDNGELRDIHTADSSHELGTILRDAALFCVLANHEARDVLQEDQRDELSLKRMPLFATMPTGCP
jgi:hypothetical protein